MYICVGCLCAVVSEVCSVRKECYVHLLLVVCFVCGFVCVVCVMRV